jgi:DNA-binding SARP family transcriptional activator
MTTVPAHATFNQQFRRCNKADCPRCVPGSPGHGPYWFARWKEDGRTHTHYLGRRLPGEQGIALGPQATAAAEQAASLRVRTLGTFAVWRGEEAIPADRWRRRTVAALFKCLLSAPRQRLERERAIDLRWPDAVPGNGDTNLRAAVYRLRCVLDAPGGGRRGGGSYLRTEGPVLVLDPLPGAAAPVDWLDGASFARTAKAALAGRSIEDCREAPALYGGEYLPDDPYEDWATRRREALQQQYCDLLTHLGRLAAAVGDRDEAIVSMRTLLAVDPCREEVASLLMRLLVQQGRPAEALQIFARLVRALQTELETVPTRETVSLRAAILAKTRADTIAALRESAPEHLPTQGERMLERAG